MKRLLRLLSALLLLASPSLASAYDFEADGIYYDIASTTDFTVEVTYKSTSYNSYSGDVAIPEAVTYDGTAYTITSIGDKAFYDCTDMTSITIPDAVTTIGEYAFYDCTYITEISIPENITAINDQTFACCFSITTITLPNDLQTIGSSAFISCPQLSKINIPDGVKSIGSEAFCNCSSIKSITIPDEITTIEDYTFYNCSSLSSINIPEGVTSIGDYAFYDCSSLVVIYSLNTTPPTCASTNCFSNYDATLHVPTGSAETYASTYVWEDFTSTVGDIDTAVESISADAEEAQPTGYYSLSGQHLDAPAEGAVTIIRYSNGTAKKVFLK